MRNEAKIAIVVMTIITAISISWLAYKIGYKDGEAHAYEYALVKTPLEYGITKFYDADKLEAEPQKWYTPEELGIVMIESSYLGHYEIYIAREHEQRALAWMKYKEFEPEAIKYGDEFYSIDFLWVTPGIGESVHNLLIQIGVALGIGWGFVAIMFRFPKQSARAKRGFLIDSSLVWE